MAHLFNPLYVAVDGNGLAMAGAKLYFYATGSSTPQNTYSDSSLTAPFVNANPVVANADGLFGPIYMPLTSDYKIILKTTADVTVATRDPYSPNAASFSTGGSNGQVPMINTSNVTSGFDWVSPLKSQIYGLTYSNNAGDATNDLDIAAGGCMDSTGVSWIQIAATTKQSDVAGAADNGASPTGMLDTGVVGNNDYYLYGIKNPTTAATRVLCSLSSTAPTLPTGYTLFRAFGWFKRSGGAIVAFKTYETEGGGLEFKWTTPTLDINLTNTLTTARRTDAVKVPLNFSVTALLTVYVTDGAAFVAVRVMCPDEADVAVSSAGALAIPNLSVNTLDARGADIAVRTSAAGLVAARANIATVDTYNAATIGFLWARR